jgi:xylulose-5-phosphate/fructose-6-phosphate phosphoketolase
MIMQRRRSFEQRQAQTHISSDRLGAVEACWRAANYLGVTQLYLQDNALLRRPLKPEDIKPRLQGDWGTQPGLNMVYVHLNRLIQDSDATILLVVGPGRGAPAILANLFLEGTLCEHYPQLERDELGLNELARQFGWPDGAPDHLAPETPGMIQQGTQIGSSLAHAVGAAFDNPDLVVACVIGDEEAETGPLSVAWAFNRFLNPVRDGAVLPILHLGGYRAAGPSILGRMDNDELDNFFTGYGYQIGIVAGDDPRKTHEAMWQAMDWAFQEIRDVQEQARAGGEVERPAWPMLILRTATGWTAPREVDGHLVEGTFRAHGLPVPDPRGNPDHLRILEQWLRSYQAESLFDEAGRPAPAVLAACPRQDRRIGRDPHANGGQLRVELSLPDVALYAADVPSPGSTTASAARLLAPWLRDALHQNEAGRNLRLFCPDDTLVRHLAPILEATDRAWIWPTVATDEHLAPDGRGLEIFDEPTCQGWLEGYLLTGRHGLLISRGHASPAAMALLEEHARWLEDARTVPWREPIASLTWLLLEDPSAPGAADAGLWSSNLPVGLIGTKGSPLRVYLPPDANSLLCVVARCLRTDNQINLVYVPADDQPQWLTMPSACEHCLRGASSWDWASRNGATPDVVLAAAGAGPMIETLAAAHLLRREMPDLRLRVVNVLDLLSLLPRSDSPQGLEEDAYASLFGVDGPVIFAFDGPAGLIHEMIHQRPDPSRFHVRGSPGRDRAATPFDRLVRNRLSRFHLAIAAIEAAPRLGIAAEPLIAGLRNLLTRHEQHIRQRGEDLPEIARWKWD